MTANKLNHRDRTSKAPKGLNRTAAVAALPKEIQRRIKGRTIDLRGASTFNLRMFEIVRERLASEMRDLGGHRYALKRPLLNAFLYHLRGQAYTFEQRLESTTAESLAANLIAEAVSHTAFNYKVPARLRTPDPNWPEDRPIIEAWPGAEDSGITLQSRGPHSFIGGWIDVPVEFASDEKPSSTAISMCLRYDPDITKLPKLAIELTGAPVSVLIRALYRDLPDSPRIEPVPKGTKQICSLIARRISQLFKVGNAKAHRPSSNLGWAAARLHEHKGLSWTQVAGTLCFEKHRHGAACREKYRKQAELFWKRCRAEFSKLPPI